MKCEKCGKEISTVLVDMFNHDGSDSFVEHFVEECEEDAAVIETHTSWTGYELSEEEQTETIECPHCRKFPFKSEEIQFYTFVRVVCFREGGEG